MKIRSQLAVALLVLGAPLHAAECVSSSRAVVAAAYRQFLEREADPAGAQNWINQLDVNRWTVHDLTRDVLKQREYRLRFLWHEVVRDAYRQVLEREPDPGGLDNWSNNLDAGAISVQNTVRGLAQSPEYHGRFIAPRTAEDAVTLLYLHLLARPPESSATVQNWVNNARAHGWGFVINQLIDSGEYAARFGTRLVPGRGRRAYDAAVIAMYRHVLVRSPESQATIDNWTNAILSQPWPAVVDSFVGAEYLQRFGQYTVPGNPPAAHFGTERFQQCLDMGGTLELPAGVYVIRGQLTVRQPITITTAGTAGRPGNCSQYRNDCAILLAAPDFYASGGMLVIANASNVHFDHILVDGNRGARLGSPSAAKCRGTAPPESRPDNRFGFNASGVCEACSFRNSASVNALCGTAFEWRGGQAVIEDSAFLDNGDQSVDFLWADGLTLLTSNGASVQRNTFVDNTDIGLICGGGTGAAIRGNVIRQVHRGTFAGLMLDNFNGSGSGDFTGAVVSENDIDCGPSKLCDFGIQIGPHAWYSTAPNIFGGTVTANVVRNVKQGINVEGAGTASAPLVLYGNTIDPISGHEAFRGCTHVTSSINISDGINPHTGLTDSWVDRRGDTTPATHLLWHDCP